MTSKANNKQPPSKAKDKEKEKPTKPATVPRTWWPARSSCRPPPLPRPSTHPPPPPPHPPPPTPTPKKTMNVRPHPSCYGQRRCLCGFRNGSTHCHVERTTNAISATGTVIFEYPRPHTLC